MDCPKDGAESEKFEKIPFKLCKFPRATSVGKILNRNEKFKIDARAPSGDGEINF